MRVAQEADIYTEQGRQELITTQFITVMKVHCHKIKANNELSVRLVHG